MTRTRRLAAVLLTLTVGQLAVAAGPAQACACGAVITHGAPDAKVANETSLIRYRDNTEDIVMSLGLTGSPTSAAWFLPVPAKPHFALADEDLFNSLAKITAPRVEEQHDGGCDEGACGAAPQSHPSPDVSVVQRVPVGPYDVATLAASNGTALSAWLKAHGFSLSPKLADGITPYAKQHWLYVAVRLNPAAGQQSLGTRLPPLRVTFASRSLVYPMRLTALAAQAQTVRLYVLADHRMRADGSGPGEADVRYADWITPRQVASGPLADLVTTRMFLTRFDQVDLLPSQVTDDYHFRRASADTTYRDVVTAGAANHGTGHKLADGLTFAAGLAGVALTVLLLTGLVIGVTVLLVRRRRRT